MTRQEVCVKVYGTLEILSFQLYNVKLFRQELVELPECKLDPSHNTHVYITPDKRKYPSVTTMLSKTKDEKDQKSLSDWRKRMGESVAKYIMITAGAIGRETHRLNENYINMIKDNHNYSLLSVAHHRNFIKYLNKISTIYGVEARLFSDKLRLAGTADLIAEYNGKLSILDYKTKRSSQSRDWMTDYLVQATAYSVMWEEMTGDKIEQIVILVSSEQNTTQEFIESPDDFKNILNLKMAKFDSMR